MTWLNNQGEIHPDNMKRADMLKMIASFDNDADATLWWLKHAAHRVSRAALKKARGQ